MKFSYKFSNLLGATYRSGNILFTPDGNSVISPVGNRLSIFDLKNHKSRTLSLESNYNYSAIALSPNGSLLIAVNDCGQAQLISMVSCTVIHTHKFQNKVQCIQFSPDGAYFAVARGNIILIFRTPGELTGEYSPFVLVRNFIGGYEDISWLDWSTDSRFLAIGCRDNSTKIIAIRYLTNFRTYNLGGHTDAIVACFFEDNSLHLNTVSRNGQLCLWECSLGFKDIGKVNKIEDILPPKITKTGDDADDSEDDIKDDIEKSKSDEKLLAEGVDENDVKDVEARKMHPFYYKKLSRHYLANEPRKEQPKVVLTATHYNKKTKILVVAFSNGSFYLYELPEVNMIHSLSVSDYPISTALFNCTGDWVALASKELGQLLVWEWQSEQYIMKQQGHTSEMSCTAYSPDGQFIATGGEDSKVKLWNTQNGFCFVTFTEHTGNVTGVQFSKNKKFLVSSSLDGTVRAFDITRYRNFRTFTSPEPVQFSCVAIDHSGELVVAGGQDVFDIYLWSVKMGNLLEVISGHEGPVTSVAFSPVATSSTLVSGSWDKTTKIWNCLEDNSKHETIDILSDVTCVAFNPNGEDIAVAALSGNIMIFNVKSASQVSSIEGRNDLGAGRSETDLITAKKNLKGKYFSSLEYSADGECILAAGNSQMICIYHVREAILVKKFQITQNLSLDGMHDFLNYRNITEFGNMALIEKREELEGGNVAIRLPGVQKGDMASRNFKPEVRIFSVKFSPTGQSFSVAYTEGLCIYSLDKGVVFDPFDLSMEVTPKAIKEYLQKEEYTKALIMAIKLNEANGIATVLEKISFQDIELICSNLPNQIAGRLLQAVARMLQSTHHIEFYLQWCCCLLNSHGNRDGVFEHHALLSLHESMSRKYELLNKICDFNKYTMRIILDAVDKQNDSQNNKSNKNSTEITADSSDDDEEMLLIKTNHGDVKDESEFVEESSSSSSGDENDSENEENRI
ncbi:periodic tryptophan protein 2 homolog [Teleopsis dalmanni]|uniref:periodic tryptophan protein 2 homolog n=1 Tax=Teleopsis dalmanni TaxID=139649 RepID=UPI0018CEFBE1|nr:periodic tryptophan protein 2 homolog [Teleopsis dalmanni]